MAYRSFEELEVWKRACRLAVDIYQATAELSPYSLRDQRQRAALSIPSNIAEGYERDSSKDFLRFLRIAKGSAAELRTQLYSARKLECLPDEFVDRSLNETKEIGAMTQGLVRARSET